MNPRHSLVIPFHNEAGNVPAVVEGAVGVLKALGGPFEVILVDDGSTDATAAEISAALGRWPECRALTIPERVGQGSALLAGLRGSRGELILTMDGDGQDEPADLPAMLEFAERGGYDLVCGWRRDRRDPGTRRLMSRLANPVRRALLRDRVHDAGCQLRVMRRPVLGALRPMDLLQTFIPALATAAGFRVGELPVRHHPRTRGASKYSLGELWWRPAAALLRLRWELWRAPR
jgi:glycosyltransferase involved in cell wall biosynthesis